MIIKIRQVLATWQKSLDKRYAPNLVYYAPGSAHAPGLAARDPERYLDYALQLPGKIAANDAKQIVVFFDEFQEIANDYEPFGNADRLTKRMRAIFQRSRGVSFLFAGSVEHMMRDLFTPDQRAFSQFGSFRNLPPIPAMEWYEGLQARFERDNCTIQQSALHQIVARGEAHPRTTMLIAQYTHRNAVERKAHIITMELVEQAYQNALVGERGTHDQILERVRAMHKLGFTIVRRIAEDKPVYPGLSRGAVRRALEQLQNAAIIENRGRGKWQFTNPLFKQYLRYLQPF